MTGVGDWRIDHSHKGFPPNADGRRAGDVGTAAWRLHDDFTTPIAVLKESALAHNLDRMRAFCAERGVHHAPHGKTTMSPELIGRQLEHGAWGMTVATAWQARIVLGFGARRLILANECVDPVGLRWIASATNADPEVEILAFADSSAAVELMSAALHEAGATRPLPVLVEVGAIGARAGARTVDQAVAVGRTVAAAPELELAGVAGFEGAVAATRDEAGMRAARTFMRAIHETGARLAADGVFRRDRPAVLSAGGSMMFDIVAEELIQPIGTPSEVVLRSGCYLTHDHGVYRANSPFESGATDFRPGLEVWARVLSTPEDGLAIIDAGRRDISHDSGYPPVLGHWRDSHVKPMPGAKIERFNDQHGFVHVPEPGQVQVGDLVALGVSHPCTTFDKWRAIPVVDDGYAVIGAVRTAF